MKTDFGKIDTANSVLGMRLARDGGMAGRICEVGEHSCSKEWNEMFAVTKTKFRQRIAGEGLREMHPRGLCVV